MEYKIFTSQLSVSDLFNLTITDSGVAELVPLGRHLSIKLVGPIAKYS